MSFMMFLDSFGIFVFALSGAISAIRQNLDIVGVLVIALLPAVGGGTIRDLVLDVPVFWVEDTRAIWLTLAATIVAWAAAPHVESRRKLLLWADAFGLALFAVVGAQKTLVVTGDPLIAVMMGTTTGVVGGLIRDVIAGDKPFVFRQEIYATAAIAGSAAYCLFIKLGLAAPMSMWSAVTVGFVIRAAGIIWGLKLPQNERLR